MTSLEREARTGWLLVLPSLIIIGLLSLYPLLFNLYLSFFDVSLTGESSFVGLNNLRYLLGDGNFWRALGVTLLYTGGTTAGTTLVGTGAALLLNRPFTGRRIVLSVILLPYAAPLISEVYSWQFLFDPVNGLFMDLLVEKSGLVPLRFNIISSAPALFISLFSIWRYFPFTCLLVLSRLQAIDPSLYDAAGVDGAGVWQKFRYITLPEIFFIVTILAMVRFIWNFSKFDEIYLLAPQIRTLSVHTYLTAFSAGDMGLAAGLALIQVVLLGTYIALFLRRMFRW